MNNLCHGAEAGSFMRPPLEEAPRWPSSRYFQIHFEHMHLALANMGRELEVLRRQVAELQRQSGSRAPGCPEGGCQSPPAPPGRYPMS
jgi:hypothetical protein